MADINLLDDLQRILEGRGDDVADKALEYLILSREPNSPEARACRLHRYLLDLKYYSTAAVAGSHTKAEGWLNEAEREAFALRVELLERRRKC